jgi:hypothetical protein
MLPPACVYFSRGQRWWQFWLKMLPLLILKSFLISVVCCLWLMWISITKIVGFVIVILPAEVSGPNPASFLFIGSNERDDLQDQVHMRKELLHQIINAAACVWEDTEMIQLSLDSCSEWVRLCSENHGWQLQVIQWNVSIMKSCGWRNYICCNKIALHWNTLRMSHRCLHRWISRAAAIESNKSRGPVRAFTVVSLSREAIEQLAESKAENVYIVACHFNSIQQKLLQTSWWMWLCFINFLFFKSLPVIVKFISAVILCNALDLYSFLQLTTK